MTWIFRVMTIIALFWGFCSLFAIHDLQTDRNALTSRIEALETTDTNLDNALALISRIQRERNNTLETDLAILEEKLEKLDTWCVEVFKWLWTPSREGEALPERERD